MDDVTKVGLLSDVHANHIALQAVLDDMEEVDAIVCAGDVVGYGPSPGQCIETIRVRDIPTVQGNHDRAVAENDLYESGDEYARRILSDDQLKWLGDLPRELPLFDGQVKLVHDHPTSPGKYTYPSEFEPAMFDGEKVLVLGHTHIQCAEQFDEGIIVNPGSVGQPRDGDPAAAYAVVNLAEQSVDLHRVQYDIYRVELRIRNSSISNRNGDRLADGT